LGLMPRAPPPADPPAEAERA